MRRVLARDDGAVAGLEVLPLGVLVFLVGTLLVANTWAVVDAKTAVVAAAREAVRAFVEADSPAAAQAAAHAAAHEALTAHGRAERAEPVRVRGTFVRCARVQATVTVIVPAVRLPWLGGLGTYKASSTASEIVDPLRSGVEGEASCVGT